MKGLRGLFRLGALTLLALTLMVVMVLPASAAKTCSSSQMLDEVEIVSVAAKESPAVWSAQGLVNFDYGGDIKNGLLEVSFKDIATDFDFDGYIIEATPGDDDPGDSAELGVTAYTSPSLVARPTIIGDTVTEVLNLEPGTKYYVTVHAVNHNTVRISPKQRAQDSAQSSATTLLSAPFLGGLHTQFFVGRASSLDAACSPMLKPGDTGYRANCLFRNFVLLLDDANQDFQGTHFAFYDAKDEAGQHYFQWLNPAHWGPFDHILDRSADRKQADMLSLDKDGKLEGHCADADITDGACGHTHYQFKAVDENGNTVASELVETDGELLAGPHDDYTGIAPSQVGNGGYFRTVFTARKGDLTLSLSLGRKVDGKYKAMSDTASVTFEVPDDLRAFDQTNEEYSENLDDIVAAIKDNEDAERWLGKKGSGDGRSIWNPREDESLADLHSALNNMGKMQAYLNNQLK